MRYSKNQKIDYICKEVSESSSKGKRLDNPFNEIIDLLKEEAEGTQPELPFIQISNDIWNECFIKWLNGLGEDFPAWVEFNQIKFLEFPFWMFNGSYKTLRRVKFKNCTAEQPPNSPPEIKNISMDYLTIENSTLQFEEITLKDISTKKGPLHFRFIKSQKSDPNRLPHFTNISIRNCSSLCLEIQQDGITALELVDCEDINFVDLREAAIDNIKISNSTLKEKEKKNDNYLNISPKGVFQSLHIVGCEFPELSIRQYNTPTNKTKSNTQIENSSIYSIDWSYAPNTIDSNAPYLPLGMNLILEDVQNQNLYIYEHDKNQEDPTLSPIRREKKNVILNNISPLSPDDSMLGEINIDSTYLAAIVLTNTPHKELNIENSFIDLLSESNMENHEVSIKNSTISENFKLTTSTISQYFTVNTKLAGDVIFKEVTFLRPPSITMSTISDSTDFIHCEFSGHEQDRARQDFQILKKKMGEIENDTMEAEFTAHELKSDYRTLTWKDDTFDKTMFCFARFFSSYGMSRSRPFILLVSMATILSLAYYCFWSEYISVTSSSSLNEPWALQLEGFSKFFTFSVINSLGPLKFFYSNPFNTNSIWIMILSFLQNIIGTILIYLGIVGIKRRIRTFKR